MSHSDIGAYVCNAANANHPHAPRRFGSTNLTYDGENRLLSVLKSGVLTCYVDGADGMRLLRVDSQAANCDPLAG